MSLVVLGARGQGVSVSDGGTAGYSLAIAVPPGIGGMVPNIGLSYSAGSVNGPVGYGWTIQGLSMITRCPGTKLLDGVVTAVNYDGNDKLCLDGQRLIQTSDAGVVVNGAVTNPGAANPFQQSDSLGGGGMVREYRTEKDSYARIRAYGMAGGAAANGPAYFKVWTKSGQIYEYGVNLNATANAQVNAAGKAVVVAWPVSRISDTVGNYIDFQYEQRDLAWGSASAAAAGHEWNLTEIRYTGNGAQLPANKVVFEYVDRADTPGTAQDRAETYHMGSKNVSVRLLSKIKTYINWPAGQAARPSTATAVKTTVLTYDRGPVSNRSRLHQVAECAGDTQTKCMPPTTFNYAPGGGVSYTPSAAFRSGPLSSLVMQSTTGGYGVLVGDFLGSGRSDIIRWSNTPSENQLYRNLGDGAFAAVGSGTGAGQFNIIDQNLFRNDGCFTSFAMDFNGDGLTDILRVMTGYQLQTCGTVRNILYLSNGDGSFRSTDITGIDFQQILSTATPHYNCLSPVSAGWLRNCSEPGNTYLGTEESIGKNFHLIDVNNDGLLDIVVTVKPAIPASTTPSTIAQLCAAMVCTHVYLGQTSGAFTELAATNLTHFSVYGDPPNRRYGSGAYVGDVNGDGMADLMVGVVWMSRGDGNFDVGTASALSAPCLFPLDFNGDGRTDCVTVYGNASLQTLSVADATPTLKNVSNFNLISAGQALSGLNAAVIANMGSQIADIDEDGRSDILRWNDDPSQNTLFLSNGDGTFRQSTGFNLTTANDQLQKSDGTSAFVMGDFIGRGHTEILRLKASPSSANDATSNVLYVKNDQSPADQLLSVVSGSGLRSTLTWVPLTNSSSGALGARYASDRTTGNAASYPTVDLTSPTYVVATLTADSGVGSAQVFSEYAYSGLKVAYDGRGWLGFRTVRHQNTAPNGEPLTVSTQNLQSGPNLGVVSRMQTWRGALTASSSPVLSSSSYVYCDRTAAAGAEAAATAEAPCPTSAKVQRPYLYKSIETGNDLSGEALPTVTTVNSFNDSGDPMLIVVRTVGTPTFGAEQAFTKSTNNVYKADNTAGDSWILGRLQKSTVSSTVPNSLASISTSAGSASLAAGTQGQLLSVANVTTATMNAATAGPISEVISANISGGVGPYSYSWSTASGTRTTVSNSTVANPTVSATLAPGETISATWNVTVTDVTGRAVTASVGVSFYAPLTLTLTVNPSSLTVAPAAAGAVSGTVVAVVGGGWAPYSYVWSHVSGSRTSISNNAVANPALNATIALGDNFTETWKVEVTDARGIKVAANVNATFLLPNAPSVTISPSLVNDIFTSRGPESRVLTAVPKDGTPPLAYKWTRLSGTRTSLSNDSIANPTLSITLDFGDKTYDDWRVTVTDAVSRTSTADISVFYELPAYYPLITQGCTINSPTTSPTPATITCGYGNQYANAIGSIIYSGPSGVTVSGGPTACAGYSLCGSVTVTTGTAAGTYAGTLTATPNNGSAVAQAFNLIVNTGVSLTSMSANPTSLAWGNVLRGVDIQKTITFTNSGNAPATGITATLGSLGGTGGYYGFGPTTCPSTVGIGQSCVVTIDMSADCTGGTKTAILTLAGGNFTTVNVPMTETTVKTGVCN